MRRDVLTGDWISVAAGRQNRAFLPPAELDPLAPQTPSNPSEIPSRYDVAVFENRSPSFGPALAEAHGDAPAAIDAPRDLDDLDAPGLGRTRTSVGRCEVVCFSPEHEGSFGTQTPTRARTVIEAWADRSAALAALPGIEQVFPFENRGEAIGVTLGHPHGQIYAYPYVTPRTQRLLAVDRARGRRPVRPHPRLRAGLRAGHPARRALDRLRAVRRALAARGAPDAAPARRRHRRDDGCRARRIRDALPPAPARRRRAVRLAHARTSRHGTRLPCTSAATRSGCGWSSPPPAAPPTSSSSSPARRPRWAPGSATCRPSRRPTRLRAAIETVPEVTL